MPMYWISWIQELSSTIRTPSNSTYFLKHSQQKHQKFSKNIHPHRLSLPLLIPFFLQKVLIQLWTVIKLRVYTKREEQKILYSKLHSEYFFWVYKIFRTTIILNLKTLCTELRKRPLVIFLWYDVIKKKTLW